MKEGKIIENEDGSIDITALMDEEDIKLWNDVFKVNDDKPKRKLEFTLFKPLKPKMRNGVMFNFTHEFKNDNYVDFSWDWYRFGFGFNYSIGDTRRYFSLCVLWMDLWIWF